jgi:hypothetical protein
MSEAKFKALVGKIADFIADAPLDADLETRLNVEFGVQTTAFGELVDLCTLGETQGWLMAREAGGIRYGRALKPGQDARHFSVDVVRMKDVKGPHHIHTTGEIGAIMPITGDPRFDGKSKGWYVYPPQSSHHPTVTDGDAYILYFLPDGAIEFTGQP